MGYRIITTTHEGAWKAGVWFGRKTDEVMWLCFGDSEGEAYAHLAELISQLGGFNLTGRWPVIILFGTEWRFPWIFHEQAVFQWMDC